MAQYSLFVQKVPLHTNQPLTVTRVLQCNMFATTLNCVHVFIIFSVMSTLCQKVTNTVLEIAIFSLKSRESSSLANRG